MRKQFMVLDNVVLIGIIMAFNACGPSKSSTTEEPAKISKYGV
jgi:hypothetical protein